MANAMRQRLASLLGRPAGTALQATRVAGGTTKRFFAAGANETDDAEETQKWRSITIAAYIACIGLGIYTLSAEEHHESERPEYSYLRIRNKQFPWGPNGLFEYEHKGHGEEH